MGGRLSTAHTPVPNKGYYSGLDADTERACCQHTAHATQTRPQPDLSKHMQRRARSASAQDRLSTESSFLCRTCHRKMWAPKTRRDGNSGLIARTGVSKCVSKGVCAGGGGGARTVASSGTMRRAMRLAFAVRCSISTSRTCHMVHTPHNQDEYTKGVGRGSACRGRCRRAWARAVRATHGLSHVRGTLHA